MRIYLVTPTWNCGAEFARCVASVLANTTQPVWWVVVENGSRPEERRLVEEAWSDLGVWPVLQAAYIENDRNLGIPVAQNQALDVIRANDPGPFGVVFLSADTEVVSEHWLDKINLASASLKNAGVIGGSRSPQGKALPVYHDHNGRWYQHTGPSDLMEGESVDFAMAYLPPWITERGIRFDTGYEIYDGYDQDLCFRVRSWGYQVYQVDAGVVHYGSATMKKTGYQWSGGGRKEWDDLRAKNVERFVAIWGDWLQPRRKSIVEERSHLREMNKRLVTDAGHRRTVPTDYEYLRVEGAALTIREREWLRGIAARVQDETIGSPVFVNIGVYRGASLHCLRAGSPWARLIGIDVKKPQIETAPQVEVWLGDSSELHVHFREFIHLLFVDGNHSEQAVKADIRGWVHKVAVGGIVAFHDYNPAKEHIAARPHIRGVRRAVDAFFDNNSAWREVYAPDSIKAFVRLA